MKRRSRRAAPARYDGTWRDRDPADAPPGVKPVIRLKAPRDGATTIHDLVQGDVTVNNVEIDDLIILRSDGSPTYLHAVVVDDHDMEISHVIRGDDHLTNTFRQVQIYKAMEWDLPHFAHMPLIHGADGAKLSKRHGAVNLLDFRDDGFLPEAMFNFLLRLGWASGDNEILTRDEAIALFDLDGVGRSAARMDYTRLVQLNGVWLRRADDDRLTADVIDRLTARGLDAPAVADRIRTLMPGLKERAKTVAELADSAAFLAQRLPLTFEPKAQALLTPDAKAGLQHLGAALDHTDWTAASLDAALRTYAEAAGKKLGQVAQPLRAALTGSTMSPPIDQTLAALGREEALARIAAA